mmetsp:Transcript_16643/g.17332  ORF Transcript_16643/g.17332 Transcript_16643/m.17332 type:complete len:889 (+) Transcript_16643:1-2667(+)
MKHFNSFLELFQKMDFMGPLYSFEIEDSTRYRSVAGATFSVLVLVSIVVLSAFFGKELLERRHPVVAINHDYTKESRLYMNEFPILFQFNTLEGNAVNNMFDYLTPFIKNTYEDENKKINISYNEFGIVNCNTKHFKNSTLEVEELLNSTNNTFFCLDFDDETHFQNQYFSKNSINYDIGFIIPFHIQYTDKADKLKKKKNGEMVIDDIIVSIYFMDYHADIDVVNNPVTHYWETLSTPLSQNYYKRIYMRFAINTISTDYGFLLEQYTSETFTSLASTVPSDMLVLSHEGCPTCEESLIFNLSLESPRFRNSIERHYIKLQDLFAKIGGVANALILSTKVISYHYLRFLYIFFLKKVTKQSVTDATSSLNNFKRTVLYESTNLNDFLRRSHTIRSNDINKIFGKTKTMSTHKSRSLNKQMISKEKDDQGVNSKDKRRSKFLTTNNKHYAHQSIFSSELGEVPDSKMPLSLGPSNNSNNNKFIENRQGAFCKGNIQNSNTKAKANIIHHRIPDNDEYNNKNINSSKDKHRKSPVNNLKAKASIVNPNSARVKGSVQKGTSNGKGKEETSHNFSSWKSSSMSNNQSIPLKKIMLPDNTNLESIPLENFNSKIKNNIEAGVVNDNELTFHSEFNDVELLKGSNMDQKQEYANYLPTEKKLLRRSSSEIQRGDLILTTQNIGSPEQRIRGNTMHDQHRRKSKTPFDKERSEYLASRYFKDFTEEAPTNKDYYNDFYLNQSKEKNPVQYLSERQLLAATQTESNNRINSKKVQADNRTEIENKTLIIQAPNEVQTIRTIEKGVSQPNPSASNNLKLKKAETVSADDDFDINDEDFGYWDLIVGFFCNRTRYNKYVRKMNLLKQAINFDIVTNMVINYYSNQIENAANSIEKV